MTLARDLANTANDKSIVQIVFAEYGIETQSTSSTLANTGLSATITPTSASNKILCIVSHTATGKESNDTWVRMTFLRGSTTIMTPISSGGRNGSTARNNFGSVTFSYLDSPATTSATTYKTMFASPNNNLGANVQVDGAPSTITLIEVTP
jgi:hypothetical protein